MGALKLFHGTTEPCKPPTVAVAHQPQSTFRHSGWITKDPVTITTVKNPFLYNRHRRNNTSSKLNRDVMNNPVRWIDPTGLIAREPDHIKYQRMADQRREYERLRAEWHRANEFMSGMDTRVFVGSYQVTVVVGTPWQHAAIIVAVNWRSNYWEDERFSHHTLFSGFVRFATFGAQPYTQPFFDGLVWFGNLTPHLNFPADVDIVTSGSPLTPLNANNRQISRLLSAEQHFRTHNYNAIPYWLFPGGRLPIRGLNSNSYVRSLLHFSRIEVPTMEGNFPGWYRVIPRQHFVPQRRVG